MPSYSYALSSEPDLGTIEAALYASALKTKGIQSVVWDGSNVVTTFTTALDPSEEAPDTTPGTYQYIVLNNATEPVPDPVVVKMQAQQVGDNALFVTQVPRRGKGSVAATASWCDKTTWWYESSRLVDQALTQNPSNPYEWGHSLSYWINVTHGKVFDELEIRDTYKAIIKVDGVELVERLEHNQMWEGDYIVNYDTGTVLFREDHTGSTVTANFSYATGSAWVAKSTEAGKMLTIMETEAQFSLDCRVHDTILFEVQGYAAFFAQAAVQAQLLNADDLVTLKTYTYDTIDQLIDRSKGSHPIIPPIGGERGMQHGRIIFKFPYDDVFELSYDLGIQLSIRLQTNTPMSGERATATNYGSIFEDNPVATLQTMLSLTEAQAQALYDAGMALLAA